MRLESLADHPQLINELAHLFCREWGELAPWSSVAVIAERLSASCRAHGMPFTFVALADDGHLLGAASVKIRELAGHPDKEFWIGEVFIRRELRGRGIGSALIRRCISRSLQEGIAALYLYTPDQQALYRKFGWQDIQSCEAHGETVSVMRLALD